MKKKSIDHTQLLLLKLLSTEDMYGYQIILELARRSSNVFEMKEGHALPRAARHGSARAMWRPMKRQRPPAACESTIT